MLQDADNEKYQLTVKLFHVGQAIADQTDFLTVARRFMPALRDKAGLTVTIGQVEAGGIRVLDMCKHRSAVEITSRPGAFFDLHCSAQGKIALAFGPRYLWEDLQKNYFEVLDERYHHRSIRVGKRVGGNKTKGLGGCAGPVAQRHKRHGGPRF